MWTGVSPSSISRALSSISNLRELRRIHALVISFGLEDSDFFSGKLIDKYAQLRNPSSSLSVFRRVSQVKNIYLWNSIIRAFSRNELFADALQFYKKLREVDVPPDKYTFPSIIKACAGLLDEKMGSCVHEHAVECGFGYDLYVGNSLIDMYSRLGLMSRAQDVFNEMSLRDLVSWNSLISGYSSNGYYKNAMELYHQLRVSDIVPDSYTVSSVLPAYGNLLAVSEGQSVHGFAQKIGIISTVVVSNGILSMYLKFSKPADARRIFDEMIIKDSVSYNTMICGYFQTEMFSECVKAFMDTMDRFTPDILTLTYVVRGCSHIRDLGLTKNVHKYMVRSGYVLETTINNILIDAYAKCGDVNSARNVFGKMKHRDLVSWNSMISGYIQSGEIIKSTELFTAMRIEGECDHVTYLMLLSVSARLSYLDLGKGLHSDVRKRGFISDLAVCNALIDMYAKCGETNRAIQIFDEMETRDVVTWNTIIYACFRIGDFTTALQLATLMRIKAEVSPDVSTFLSILPMCSSLAAKRLGKEIHCCLIRFGFELELEIGNCLVEMYSRCGNLKSSVRVFEYMVTRDVVTWTTLIYAYGMYGEGKKALEAFSRMENCGIKPDNIAFIAIIYACSHSGLVEEGLACFDRMKNHYKITPAIEHYACVVDLLSRSWKISKAEEFIEAMPVKPKAGMWASLLNACRAKGDMETAKRVSRKIIELNPEDPGYTILASNTYASMRNWDEVSCIRKSLKTKHVKKRPGYSWIEIDRKVVVFRSGDTSIDMYEEINKLMEMMYGLMEKEGYVANVREVTQKLEEEEEKIELVCGHSERLAIAYGLLKTKAGKPLEVMKNLRVCGDCHEVTKLISKIVGREILVRDANRFHLFANGSCSCRDRW